MAIADWWKSPFEAIWEQARFLKPVHIYGSSGVTDNTIDQSSGATTRTIASSSGELD